MPAGVSEARAKTRDTFNEVLKKYTNPPSEKKKSKKKSSEHQESIVLHTLKHSPNVEKDTEEDETSIQNAYEDETSIQNAYEQGSPRFNTRGGREIAEKVKDIRNEEDTQPSKGKKKSRRALPSPPVHEDTPGYIQNDSAEDANASRSEVTVVPDDVAGAASKRKSRKGKNKGDAERQVAVDAEDELLREYQLQIAQVEEERTTKKGDENTASQDIVLNNDVGKKKKKKTKSVNTESEMREEEELTEQDAVAENKAESKGKKKAKRKQVIKDESETEADVPKKPTFDENLVLAVYIHRTDRLKTDLQISHPMVKVHVINETTGQYVKKEDCHRPVISYYEQDNVEHILPIMTQPFDFKKNKSTVPEWEEQIIFNERFGYFLQDDDTSPRVILFFEVIDFMTMEEARANIDVDKRERGFRKIAWAFLKLVGTNGVLNIDTKVRLQLFCPPPRAKKQTKSIEVVDWWRKHPRSRYASTLYITVKGIKLPEHVDPSMRSMMALQEERGTTSYSELQSEVTRRSLIQPLDSESKASVLKWSRMPGQICRIPNKPVLSFRGGRMGCFTVRFSHDGTTLAAACADRDAFPVIVYEIPSGKVLAAFNGHLSIVYDLCWSRDDRSLLSASSDGTVRIWNVEELLGIAQKVLPHPKFVYCAQFHPMATNLVVTGGYDCLVRVWRLDVHEVNGQLLQEFEGHSSFINTACFDCEGRRMFTADNNGLIIVWKTSLSEGKQRQPCRHWCIERKIDERDLSGIPINMLEVHPNGRRLLIHAKDSVLRVMDLRILAIKKYTGATNYRERIYSTFTPCGNFIFSGSEDGMAYVWNAETGDQLAVYSELCYPTALRGVAFHPHENMVAFCAFGQSQPVHIYMYDHKVSQLEVRNMKALNGNSSSDTKTTKNPSENMIFQDTSASSIDQCTQAARMSLKMRRVKDKLDSMLEPRQRSQTPEYFYEQDKVSMTQMGRSLTLDTGTVGPSTLLPVSSLLSPHSKMQLSGSVAEPLVPQASLSSQSRGFSPVGQRLKRATSLRLQANLHDHASPANRLGTEPTTVQQTVISLYDYSANRSDELTVNRGDVIHVLYKDNDSWWFGRLANGQQGYFPASYVAEERDLDEEASQSDGNVERSTPTKISAAISASGELKFLSEQDTDPELNDNKGKRKKKVKRLGVPPSPPSQAPSSDPESHPGSLSSRRRARSTNRPLPKRPTGRPNEAFEPDN